MDWITPEDFRKMGEQEALDLIDAWQSAAVSDLNRLTCNALTLPTDTVTGVVQYDNVTVNFPVWASKIDAVKYGETNLNYDFKLRDIIGDETAYARSLTLTVPMAEGSTVTVTGTFGFIKLPNSLLQILSSYMRLLNDAGDGSGVVTSKKIEDVSVNYAQSATTPLDNIMQRYRSLLLEWSLYADTSGYGQIIPNRPIPRHPYWAPAADGYHFFGGIL